MNYSNPHNLYKLTHFDFWKYHNQLKKINKSYDLMDGQNQGILRGRLWRAEEDKIRRDFINKNFVDLTSKEKDILLINLIKAEQFSPTERF
jgi:hypothetical protein